MEHELKLYNRYKNKIKLRLVMSGLWPDYSPHPKAFRMLLTVVSGFTSAAITFGIINFVYKNMTNINVMIKGLGLMISFLPLFLKIFILSMYEKDLRYLNEVLSISFENDLETPTSRSHLLAHFPTFSKFFYTFDYSAVINLLLMIITSLLMVKHGKYLRMYPQIVPFSYEPGGIVNWSIFAFENLAGFYLWTISCGVDSVFGLYTLHLVGELRLLSTPFENLKASEKYKKELKDCVDQHVLLMQSRSILERVFGFLSISLVVTCAIVMCVNIFQVYQSELCLNSIYNAFWSDSGDTSFMRGVLIILSQKLFVFRANSCVLLRLDVFLKIIKTSVSYFFLLQTLEEDLEVL